MRGRVVYFFVVFVDVICYMVVSLDGGELLFGGCCGPSMQSGCALGRGALFFCRCCGPSMPNRVVLWDGGFVFGGGSGAVLRLGCALGRCVVWVGADAS